MKSTILLKAILITMLIIPLGLIHSGAEGEETPSASADIGLFSKYIWRGWELSDDSVVIQPSITVGYTGFGFNVWGNLDTDYDDDSEWNETDFTLSYDRTIGDFNANIGYIYYALDGGEDAEEFYVSMSASNWPLCPTLTVYREIAALQGWYIDFSLSHSIEFKDGITLDMGASAGYYNSSDDSFVEYDSNLDPTPDKYKAFHDGVISVGLTVPFTKYFTFTPMIAYSFPLSDTSDDLLTAENISGDADHIYGGVTLSIAF